MIFRSAALTTIYRGIALFVVFAFSPLLYNHSFHFDKYFWKHKNGNCCPDWPWLGWGRGTPAWFFKSWTITYIQTAGHLPVGDQEGLHLRQYILLPFFLLELSKGTISVHFSHLSVYSFIIFFGAQPHHWIIYKLKLGMWVHLEKAECHIRLHVY